MPQNNISKINEHLKALNVGSLSFGEENEGGRNPNWLFAFLENCFKVEKYACVGTLLLLVKLCCLLCNFVNFIIINKSFYTFTFTNCTILLSKEASENSPTESS